MKGISTITYQGKTILVVDFAEMGKTKETTLELIEAMKDEFLKHPLKSVLALINVTHIYFHIKTLHAFRQFQEEIGPYGKKVVIVGLKGLMKSGFNSVAGSNKNVKAFDSETEAKEWLVNE